MFAIRARSHSARMRVCVFVFVRQQFHSPADTLTVRTLQIDIYRYEIQLKYSDALARIEWECAIIYYVNLLIQLAASNANQIP